jgi:hypothetical protein
MFELGMTDVPVFVFAFGIVAVIGFAIILAG